MIHLYLCRHTTRKKKDQSSKSIFFNDQRRQVRCFTKADSLFTVPMFSAISESAPGNSCSHFQRDSRMHCHFTVCSLTQFNKCYSTHSKILSTFCVCESFNPHRFLPPFLTLGLHSAGKLHDSGGILSQKQPYQLQQQASTLLMTIDLKLFGSFENSSCFLKGHLVSLPSILVYQELTTTE